MRRGRKAAGHLSKDGRAAEGRNNGMLGFSVLLILNKERGEVMRKILIAVMAMVTMFWFTSPTNALPLEIRDGGKMYYDPNLNITWLSALLT